MDYQHSSSTAFYSDDELYAISKDTFQAGLAEIGYHPTLQADLAQAFEQVKSLSEANADLTHKLGDYARKIHYLELLARVNGDRLTYISLEKAEQLDFFIRYQDMERKLNDALIQQKVLGEASPDEQVQILLARNHKLEGIIHDRERHALSLSQELIKYQAMYKQSQTVAPPSSSIPPPPPPRRSSAGNPNHHWVQTVQPSTLGARGLPTPAPYTISQMAGLSAPPRRTSIIEPSHGPSGSHPTVVRRQSSPPRVNGQYPLVPQMEQRNSNPIPAKFMVAQPPAQGRVSAPPQMSHVSANATFPMLFSSNGHSQMMPGQSMNLQRASGSGNSQSVIRNQLQYKMGQAAAPSQLIINNQPSTNVQNQTFTRAQGAQSQSMSANAHHAQVHALAAQFNPGHLPVLSSGATYINTNAALSQSISSPIGGNHAAINQTIARSGEKSTPIDVDQVMGDDTSNLNEGAVVKEVLKLPDISSPPHSPIASEETTLSITPSILAVSQAADTPTADSTSTSDPYQLSELTMQPLDPVNEDKISSPGASDNKRAAPSEFVEQQLRKRSRSPHKDVAVDPVEPPPQVGVTSSEPRVVAGEFSEKNASSIPIAHQPHRHSQSSLRTVQQEARVADRISSENSTDEPLVESLSSPNLLSLHLPLEPSISDAEQEMQYSRPATPILDAGKRPNIGHNLSIKEEPVDMIPADPIADENDLFWDKDGLLSMQDTCAFFYDDEAPYPCLLCNQNPSLKDVPEDKQLNVLSEHLKRTHTQRYEWIRTHGPIMDDEARQAAYDDLPVHG